VTVQRTIYVVEDEPQIGAVVRDYLLKAGYAVQLFDNGKDALEAFHRREPSLLLLDIMLPEIDGITVCREVRKTSEVPVIMLTAMVEEIDRLLGLEMGADDYICKPFSPREVVARVKAALRRWPENHALVPAGDLVHEEAGSSYLLGGERLALTNTEYRLLRLLHGSPGRVFSRAQLLDLCYDPDQDVSDRAIDSHIKNLRRKLHAVSPQRDFVHSVYGVGYRFEPE
jgi:two-component system response regulator BaeR